MSIGVNKVILIGNLGSDPDVRHTPGGSSVANINLATSETWRDKESGKVNTRTEWHHVVVFNKLSNMVGQYLRKGSKIYVEGILRTRKWVDKNGVEKQNTEIIANIISILSTPYLPGDKWEGKNKSSGSNETQMITDFIEDEVPF